MMAVFFREATNTDEIYYLNSRYFQLVLRVGIQFKRQKLF